MAKNKAKEPVSGIAGRGLDGNGSETARRSRGSHSASGQVAALVAAAGNARKRAVAPYSGFKVGAALLTARGSIVTGANVESASYGLTCCAERIALFKALTQGYSEFVAIAIVARLRGGPMPCGACRQLLAEYAPAADVWVADALRPRRVRRFTVQALLPGPFVRVPSR